MELMEGLGVEGLGFEVRVYGLGFRAKTSEWGVGCRV